jgi:hypothetical protein
LRGSASDVRRSAENSEAEQNRRHLGASPDERALVTKEKTRWACCTTRWRGTWR